MRGTCTTHTQHTWHENIQDGIWQKSTGNYKIRDVTCRHDITWNRTRTKKACTSATAQLIPWAKMATVTKVYIFGLFQNVKYRNMGIIYFVHNGCAQNTSYVSPVNVCPTQDARSMTRTRSTRHTWKQATHATAHMQRTTRATHTYTHTNNAHTAHAPHTRRTAHTTRMPHTTQREAVWNWTRGQGTA